MQFSEHCYKGGQTHFQIKSCQFPLRLKVAHLIWSFVQYFHAFDQKFGSVNEMAMVFKNASEGHLSPKGQSSTSYSIICPVFAHFFSIKSTTKSMISMAYERVHDKKSVHMVQAVQFEKEYTILDIIS